MPNNKFLSYDAERAPKVRRLFTVLAPRYDLANDLQSFGLHRRWKRRLAALATRDARPGWRVLDLCCGTGDVVFAARDQSAPLVVGLDFTEAMLAIALQRRAAGEGDDSAQFVQGDALRLPFADTSFDAVTVAYGLRNVADIEASLDEMLRVLRPGGRIVVLDCGKPDNALARALFFGWLRVMLPVVGWLFHRDADTYLYILESLRSFPAQRGLETMMRRAGMVNVRVENLLLGTMAINYGERAT
jgi:demethylmenaquinone methyltransferase/2-methoxy-6-polyprenyl-1,4-benzoquinol methylase